MVSKRIFDLSLALVSLVAFSPLIAVISFLLFCFQGRPIFFTQARLGLKGEIFYLFKFRTMRPQKNEEASHSLDRLTPLGKVLRSFSLDELPGLINIIKGEMSIVGPRPLLVQYKDRYTDQEMKRHDVLPGLTGWAQVNGRNTLSWSDKFNFDIWYVENRSFFLDLKIILLTFKVIFTRSGINFSGKEVMEEFDPGLYVFGAGGHAKVVLSTLMANNLKVMGIFDDNPDLVGKKILGIPVLGPLPLSRSYKIKKAVMGIGSNKVRQKLARDYDYNWISVIHPRSIVDNSVHVGRGAVIFAGAIINHSAVIGDFSIINSGSIIEHDCNVGNFSHVCPGAILTGGVNVGESSFVGAGAKINPGKSIGKYSTIGAGAVVTKNIRNYCTAVGVPAVIKDVNYLKIQSENA